MVQDLSYNLCESLVENIGEVAGIGKKTPPTPITYLTQWKMMGNSVVHTDEYLTQWKVEGNSVVDNNAILSCGDLGQDGKYHVKISNGVSIYDIPLTEPLRKVNDIADSIEFANGVGTLTRNIGNKKFSDLLFIDQTASSGRLRFQATITNKLSGTNNGLLCSKYTTAGWSDVASKLDGGDMIIGTTSNVIAVHDEAYTDADTFKTDNANVEVFYLLATPTTEIIQVSPFPISPTDTYTSANDTPYSAFEFKKNVEIWSCGEYSEVDGKYHILVQPLGGSIADIALDEPLRKVNDVADSIEFVDGVGTLTRTIKSVKWNDIRGIIYEGGNFNRFYTQSAPDGIAKPTNQESRITICISGDFIQSLAALNRLDVDSTDMCMAVYSTGCLYIRDFSIDDAQAFKAANADVEIIFELATPITETIQVPQIEDADSYSCVISQGGKAIEWSSFETN